MGLTLIKREWRFFFRAHLLQVLCMVMGLFGFLLIENLKESFSETLNQQSKLLMSSDLQVSSRRQLTGKEESLLAKKIQTVAVKSYRVMDIYSMAYWAKKGDSKLVEIRSVGEGFPFYGTLLNEQGQSLSFASDSDLFTKNCVYISKDLQGLWQIAIGEAIRLGEATYNVCAVVAKDSTQGLRGFSLAPRLYLAQKNLNATGLIKSEGTTGNFSWHYQLKQDQEDVKLIQQDLFKLLPDPGIKILRPEESSQQLAQSAQMILDYFQLATIVGFLLSLIGLYYLCQSYFLSRQKDFAILKAIGVPTSQMTKTLIGVLASNFFIAFVLCLILEIFLVPTVFAILTAKLQINLVFVPFSLRQLTHLVGLAVLAALTIAPTFYNITRWPISALIKENGNAPEMSLIERMIFGLLFSGLLALLTFELTSSFKLTVIFLIGLSGVLLVLGSAFTGILKSGDYALTKSSSLSVKHAYFSLAIRSFFRRKWTNFLLMLSLGLGASLISVILNLKTSIESDLLLGDDDRPSLFMFDIQEDQIHGLKQLMEEKKYPLQTYAPMVRAKLTEINGKAYARVQSSFWPRTREEENDDRFKQRVMNLSVAEELNPSETLMEGKNFPDLKNEVPKGMAPISLEYRFAKRLGLTVGDKLKFDILGVDIEGVVVNLRKVRWTSFRPNFFITFAPGLLDDAPKSFIMSLGQLPMGQKASVQNDIVSKFSNVSIVDVEVVMTELTGLFKQMYLALLAVSTLSLLVGLVIVYAIIQDQLMKRAREIMLFKALGFSSERILKQLMVEYGISIAGPTIGGLACGGLLASALSTYLFEKGGAFNAVPVLVACGAILLLSLIILVSQVFSLMKLKPSGLLQAP